MKQIIFLYFTVFTTFSVTSQNITNDIDGLFSMRENLNGPGGVVLVTQNNKTVFEKAYGLENISYKIPNTSESVFNIGSMSKQFTAMGIVLLQMEGKLSIDDDIKKYLPELNNFGKPITIRHLLHHTSGFRSSPELFGLAGWRDGDAISNEDFYRYLTKQTALNFEPGSEYMYTNSGYILLAKIIENVSKQNFKSWMKEKIFQPLQMNATFIEENSSNVVSKVATSYSEIEPSVFNYVENNDLTYGASNVYSTSKDVLKWMKNFNEASMNWKSAFEMLKTVDVLNSGQKNNYGFGVFVDDFFGNHRIQHTGAIAGFRSVMYSYPDDNLEIIILSNFASNQLSKTADQISQLFLQSKLLSETYPEEIKPITLNNEVLKKYEGMYWSDKNNYSRKIYVENNTLWYLRSNNKKSPLIPITSTEFQMGGINEKLLVKFDIKTNTMKLISADNSIDVFEKYVDKPLLVEDLKEYTGTFYSSELETYYTISLKDDKLIGYHSRFGEFDIQILKQDVLSWSGMAVSKYKRNKKGSITGLTITMSRIRDLWFEKKQ
ncbi:beta-lactamase family protein [Flavobacterium sp. F372]|uniref:Beta-lactamase family protein n=1 Tax=Flavobacterium bernardetii TaxID=2813823 RepID=A0ABR7J1Z1_9FLAO|nr:serine hydrolase domain-containing protein [Flavobacterium bernardetii]MBC5836051.1 beta-lactamase family protein [Flavobacterium bernardetii]NHF71209.1 beta-lactamase family protein [Flavobacterium bernardetii]